MTDTICIIGLGYVGLPLAVAFAKHYPVICFDVKKKRVEELQKGNDETRTVSSEELENLNLSFTTNSEEIQKADYVIVAVPTPVDQAKHPDISHLEAASKIVGQNLKKGAIVIYESTVYPCLTEEVCLPIIEKESGMKLGDFGLGYSPERINPGDDKHRLDNVIKIVSGHNKETLEKVAALYEKIVKAGVYKASSIKVAEAAKVVENVQRDMNIALMNELSLIFNNLNIDTKEVLDAAGTKWNFHKYYPGLVGGHCFDKNATVFLKNKNNLEVKSIGQYIDSLHCRKEIINDTEIFYPSNVTILSYDIADNRTSFKLVTIASRRKCNEILRIKSAYNYSLEVTDRHPVIVYENKSLKIKLAKDVIVGDKIILNKNLPSRKKKIIIDILPYLNKSIYKKIRVEIKGKKIKDFKETISKTLKGKNVNYYNYNYLPLEKYLLLEKKLNIPKSDIYLCTGRGPWFKKFPRIFNIDNDILRLIGYYLSEGCITNDRSLRTRFTFHREEREYIEDVTTILKKAGIDYSIYQDKTYKSTIIKVSSNLFGLLLKDILKCGTNCYNMQIPELFFDLNKKSKGEILKGLFRGDGGVTWYYGGRAYTKNGKRFRHDNNSIEVSYFTASPVLFQQMVLFLLNQNILPKLAKRKGYLSIMGHKDVRQIKNWFLGEKKKKVGQYLENKQKQITYKYAKKYKHFMTINVQSIEEKKTDYVYSIEVSETHTLVTSNGIVAHNCIGVDPYYLAYQAVNHGYHPKIILSGREVNDYMARHVAELAIKELNNNGKVLKDSTIALLGLTFKEDVTDVRNSRAENVIQYLRDYGITVIAVEPNVSGKIVKERCNVVNVSFAELPTCDAIIIVNKHKEFLTLKLDDIKQKTKILIDTKRLFDKKDAEAHGFVYKAL